MLPTVEEDDPWGSSAGVMMPLRTHGRAILSPPRSPQRHTTHTTNYTSFKYNMSSSLQWGNFGFGRAVSIAYTLGIAMGLGIGLALFSSSLKDLGLCIFCCSLLSSSLLNFTSSSRLSPSSFSHCCHLISLTSFAPLASFPSLSTFSLNTRV